MSEYRYDPLIDRRVIISPSRAARPRAFLANAPLVEEGPCPFCEGHEEHTPGERYAQRAPGSRVDGPGWTLRVVPNLYPALTLSAGGTPGSTSRLSVAEDDWTLDPGIGEHEVIIDTPRHVMSLSEMTDDEVESLFIAMRERVIAWEREPRLSYVSIFKNVGRMAGASLAHAHSQLLATSMIPPGVLQELAAARRAHERAGGCGFCARLERELQGGDRLIARDAHVVALAPAAPRLPFESWIMPREHAASIGETAGPALRSAALLARETVVRLERLYPGVAYNLALCTAPLRWTSNKAIGYHWRLEILPRLGQPAGFEWGAGLFVNVVTPEDAAARLREAGAGESSKRSVVEDADSDGATRRARTSLARME